MDLCFVNAAAPGSNLVLIFDASGSMWGQIDGEAKITIAKRVMEAIINDLPDDINVGLTAYGHRRKGDCDDLETIIPLGPINKQAFTEKIKAINPKGKTPMLRSIRLTAESIKHLEDETTILLVSDGKETCDPEPCAFVAELKDLGINFVMHVVGFDVGGETEEELKCMADAGGGEYFPASNADKLKEALTAVIEKTVEKNLKVSALLNGKPLDVQVVVLNPQTGGEVKQDQSTKTRPASFGLPPGVYDVKVIDAWVQESHPSKLFKAVEVTENDVTEITAKFGAGRLEVFPIKEGKLFEAPVAVKSLDGVEYHDQSTLTKPAGFDLGEGVYTASVRDAWGSKAVMDLGQITVIPGETIKKEAVFETGVLEVSPIRNGKLFYAAVELTKPDGEVIRNDSTENAPSTFEVLPGVYSIEIRDDWGDKSKRTFKVEIKGGETIRKTVDFDAPQEPETSQPPEAGPPSSANSEHSAGSSIPDAKVIRELAAAQSQGMAQLQAAADQLKQTGVVSKPPAVQAAAPANEAFSGAGVPPDVKTGVQSGTQVGARIDEDMIGAHVAGEDEEDPPLAKMPYNRDEWTLGRVYPLQARRNSDTLNRRLNSCEEQAGKQNRPDLLPRIQAARSQVEALNKLLKKKASKEAIQEALYNLAEEVMDVHNALAI